MEMIMMMMTMTMILLNDGDLYDTNLCGDLHGRNVNACICFDFRFYIDSEI